MNLEDERETPPGPPSRTRRARARGSQLLMSSSLARRVLRALAE